MTPDARLRGERVATLVVVAVLTVVLLAVDRATEGRARGPVALLVPIAFATWHAGASAGLTVVVLAATATFLADLEHALDNTALAARAVDLFVGSLVVGGVTAACDHLRRHWPTVSATPTAGELAARLERELDRLAVAPGSLTLARIRVHGTDRPSGAAIVRAVLETARVHDLAVEIDGEVLLLLPDTDGPGARLALDRHRARIAALGTGEGVRTSSGAVCFRSRVPVATALARADAALRLACRVGHDHVVVVERRHAAAS